MCPCWQRYLRRDVAQHWQHDSAPLVAMMPECLQLGGPDRLPSAEKEEWLKLQSCMCSRGSKKGTSFHPAVAAVFALYKECSEARIQMTWCCCGVHSWEGSKYRS